MKVWLRPCGCSVQPPKPTEAGIRIDYAECAAHRGQLGEEIHLVLAGIGLSLLPERS